MLLAERKSNVSKQLSDITATASECCSVNDAAGIGRLDFMPSASTFTNDVTSRMSGILGNRDRTSVGIIHQQ